MAIDVTAIGLGVDTSKLRQGTKDLDAFGRSANKAAGQADQSTKSMSSMAAIAGKLAVVLGAAGLGRSLITVIDANTKYTAQLKLATQSQAQFNTALADVQRIARTAQSDLGSVATLYARLNSSLRDLGVTQNEVARITENVGLALKVSGATASESSSAILQLSQAFASGVLRGEEFNAVNESAPALMRALAESIGVPVGALREMASQGQITSDVLNKAFSDEKLLEKFRQQAKEVNTISGAWTVLSNEVSAAAAGFAQSSGMVDLITGSINALSAAMISLRENLSSREVKEFLARLIPGGGIVTDVAKFAAVINRNRRIATGGPKELSNVPKNYNSIGGASAITSTGSIAPNFGVENVVGNIDEIHRAQEEIARRQKSLDDLRKASYDKRREEVLNDLQMDIDFEMDIKETRDKTELKAIEDAKEAKLKADKELAESRERYMDAEQKRANDNFKQAQDTYKKQAEEYEKIFERANENLSRSLTDSIIRGFDNGKKFIENFKDAISNAFKGYVVNIGVNFIQNALSGITGSIGRSIAGIFGLGGSGSAMASQGGILSEAKSIFDVVTKGFDGANIAFEQGIQQFGTWITEFGSIGETLGGAISQYSGAIASALPYTGAVLKLLQGDIKGAAFTGAGTAIGSLLGGPIGGVIGGALGSLVGGLFGGKSYKRYGTSVSGTQSSTGDYQKTGQGIIYDRSISSVADPLNNINKSFSNTLMSLFKAFDINSTINTYSGMYQRGKSKKSGGIFSASIDGVDIGRIDVVLKKASLDQVYNALVDKVFGEGLVKAIQTSSLSDGVKKFFDGMTKKEDVLDAINTLSTLSFALKDLPPVFDAVRNAIDTTSYTTSIAGLKAQFDAIGVYTSLFYTDAEKFDTFTAQLTRQFNLLNVAIPESRDAFRKLVDGIDVVDDASRNQFNGLIALAPAMDAYYKQLEAELEIKKQIIGLDINRFGTFANFVIANSYANAGQPIPAANMPSYDVGTSYVPNDGVAMLHTGEAVLTRSENNSISFNSEKMVTLLSTLVTKVGQLEYNMQRTADGTQRTARELEDITGGDVAITTQAA